MDFGTAWTYNQKIGRLINNYRHPNVFLHHFLVEHLSVLDLRRDKQFEIFDWFHDKFLLKLEEYRF